MNTYYFTVDKEYSGYRLDKFLASNLSDISRNYIQELIEDRVKVNDKKVKSSFKLSLNDCIYIEIPDAKVPDIAPANIPLDILYEDDEVIVINKPKGMPVHPSNGHQNDTVVNSLLYTHKNSLSGINGVLRPGIVHRIDMNTTGALIVCKNDRVHNIIAEQIKSHQFERHYLGIVHGNIKNESGTISGAIGRDPKNRKKMAIVPNGKEAITHYKVIKQLLGYSYMQFQLETGRTHQIRVHMASIGHPLLGDDVYGPKKSPFKLQGQTLHAHTISFVSPDTNRLVTVEAPVPPYFSDLLKKLST